MLSILRTDGVGLNSNKKRKCMAPFGEFTCLCLCLSFFLVLFILSIDWVGVHSNDLKDESDSLQRICLSILSTHL